MELSQENSARISRISKVESLEEWPCSSDEVSDSEAYLEDSKDEEFFYEMGLLNKLQFRKDASKACWKSEIGMAEVVEHKGRLFISMGIVRNGKIYCSIEETLFLAEIGALLLVDEKDITIPLKEIYEKVAEDKSGCSWEGFAIYRHLKSLGYIVGRHGIPWSLKNVSSSREPLLNTSDTNQLLEAASERSSIVQLLTCLNIREAQSAFEVYLPNSKFRKTSPGDPNFVVFLSSPVDPSTKKASMKNSRKREMPEVVDLTSCLRDVFQLVYIHKWNEDTSFHYCECFVNR